MKPGRVHSIRGLSGSGSRDSGMEGCLSWSIRLVGWLRTLRCRLRSTPVTDRSTCHPGTVDLSTDGLCFWIKDGSKSPVLVSILIHVWGCCSVIVFQHSQHADIGTHRKRLLIQPPYSTQMYPGDGEFMVFVILTTMTGLPEHKGIKPFRQSLSTEKQTSQSPLHLTSQIKCTSLTSKHS